MADNTKGLTMTWKVCVRRAVWLTFRYLVWMQVKV